MKGNVNIKVILKACILIVIILFLVTPGPNLVANVLTMEENNNKLEAIDGVFEYKHLSTCQTKVINGVDKGSKQEQIITTLADNSSEKNLTFNDAGDITEYLSIPSNATVLSAQMNLTGLGLEIETENLIFSDDFEDGDISDWTSNTAGSGYIAAEMYPGPDWSMNVYSPSSSKALAISPSFTMEENEDYNVTMEFGFETPIHWMEVFRNQHINAVLDDSVGGGEYSFICRYGGSNYLIMKMSPYSSYNIKYMVRPNSNKYDVYVGNVFKRTCDCDPGGPTFPQFRLGDFESGSSNYGTTLYDDFIIMQNSSVLIYPLNSSLDVGDDSDLQWNYTGEFDVTETVPDFSDELNEFLSSCTPEGDNCTVPLVFYSDSAGIIKISDIQIIYTLPESDTMPPEITDVTLITSNPLDTIIGWENFTCTVTDNTAVDKVKLALTRDTTTEYPMTKDGDDYHCNITIGTAGRYDYHIWANDTNRNYNTSIPQPFNLSMNADVNEDGSVGFVDIMSVAGMWGATGPNGWHRADVNNDGSVAFVDVMSVAGMWGQE